MMIAGGLAEPCADPCSHGICRELRAEAGRECSLCGRPIGYHRFRVIVKLGVTMHWSCVVESVRRRAQQAE